MTAAKSLLVPVVIDMPGIKEESDPSEVLIPAGSPGPLNVNNVVRYYEYAGY